ncbi:golgi uridine diphosphate-N- acetylglucosamine transporter [Pleurotus pulmonarius]|nr:golgi uridine diphosphate-N- acetylglucosamine transporter [Pleurotus pulmonarius]
MVSYSPGQAQSSKRKSGNGAGSGRTSLNGTLKDVVGDPGIKLSQAAPAVLDIYWVVSMLLGGCCANVMAYEQLLKTNPRIGSALTFSQMLFITMTSLPSFLVRKPHSIIPRLKPRQVPLYNWAIQVAALTSGSLMNNWVFAFNVPLTVQIVFRSAGLPVSMLIGRFVLQRRYSFLQVTSVFMVSVGVILATLSRPSSGKTESSHDIRQYSIGITMLFASLFLTGFLGLLQERTYKKYGPCWQEGVFYTHFLSLPIFLFLASDVKSGFHGLSSPRSGTDAVLSVSPYIILAVNLVSQLICVSAVNRLSSQVSSVSTNIVLTARKATSLCLSVWWFGNGWNWQLGAGAGMVFLGSSLFTVGGDKGAKTKEDVKPKKE